MTLPLPTRPGHVHAYLLPGEDGLDARRHRDRAPRCEGDVVGRARAGGRRPRRDRLRHALPSGPRRRRRRSPRADRRARGPGRARLRAVRARVGEPGLVGAAGRLVRAPGAPDDVTAELVGQSSVYRPFVRYQRDPILVEAGERVDGWELIAALRTRGRAALPPARRRAHRCGSPARADHADGWVVAREPARSARRLPRRARPHHRARAESRISRPRRSRSRIRPAVLGSCRSITGLRLEETVAALTPEPQSGYEVSFALFGADLPPAGTAVRHRRDAVAPRAARQRRSGPPTRGRRSRYLYSRLIDGRRDPA